MTTNCMNGFFRSDRKTILLPIIQDKTMPARVRVLAMIQIHSMVPGDKILIPVSSWARDLEVSRSTVNDALKHLVKQGHIIQYTQGTGPNSSPIYGTIPTDANDVSVVSNPTLVSGTAGQICTEICSAKPDTSVVSSPTLVSGPAVHFPHNTYNEEKREREAPPSLSLTSPHWNIQYKDDGTFNRIEADDASIDTFQEFLKLWMAMNRETTGVAFNDSRDNMDYLKKAFDSLTSTGSVLTYRNAYLMMVYFFRNFADNYVVKLGSRTRFFYEDLSRFTGAIQASRDAVRKDLESAGIVGNEGQGSGEKVGWTAEDFVLTEEQQWIRDQMLSAGNAIGTVMPSIMPPYTPMAFTQ